jgi:heme/copper-type cytochrome/quinol oxidase subunit 2
LSPFLSPWLVVLVVVVVLVLVVVVLVVAAVVVVKFTEYRQALSREVAMESQWDCKEKVALALVIPPLAVVVLLERPHLSTA